MSYPGIPQAPSAPPPPPPPPTPGQVPALRISTASEFGPRKTAFNGSQEPYEPPAAIQNAMMTKDKKPFTYTPGMGGKLDLSQIRSPRMARRVAKNANDEGIEGPPKSALAQEPRSPPGANIYSAPPVAVPVFPQNMPQQPATNLRNSTLAPRSPPVLDRQAEPAPRPVVRIETRIHPANNTSENQSPLSPPTSPTQVTLAKAPTPWMQKQVKQQDELPEWARRTNFNRSQDSSSGSESPQQQQQQPSTPQATQPRQIVVVSTAKQPPAQPHQQMRPVRQDTLERVVPVRIEDRPSVFSAMNETGHHQLSNTTPHHQSRWGNPVGQSAPAPQTQGGARLIPIQIDGQSYQTPNSVSSPTSANHNQMQYRAADNQTNRNGPRGQVPNQQAEPGPVQSKSFRVLQKITDTDPDQVNEDQVRKLQLTEDDRFLMNKFKEQVDGDTYLHKEEDPRYRGAAIPSRAFRYLQTMTDAGDAPNSNTTSRPVNPATKKQNRNSNTFEEVPIPVQYVPASEQQVPEPKKYMGGAIPSRSFRILQAMTAPESIATQVMQENRQDSAADFVNMPDNQQPAVYYYPNPNPDPSNLTSAYWNPEYGWWACYPVSTHLLREPYHPHYHYYYYDPKYYTNTLVLNNTCASELNCNNSDESTFAECGNPLNRNSDIYSGTERKSDLMATPGDCPASATIEQSNVGVAEPQQTLSSSSSSLPSDDESESEKEGSYCSSSKRNGDDEENDSTESSNSSYTSDYQNQEKDVVSCRVDEDGNRTKEEERSNNDSSNNGKENHVENYQNGAKKNSDGEESKSQSGDQEDNNTTVSISLPLRRNPSASEKNKDAAAARNVTHAEDVETYVAFTLKRPNSQDKPEEESVHETVQVKPSFIVTNMDEDETENVAKTQETTTDSDVKDKSQTLLTVQSHSKEEVTDDDDSGVTSDTSRIISEAETDSECCQPTIPANVDENPPVTKRSSSKYTRTQTHSRLFKLLTDEQLRTPRTSNRLSCHYEDVLSPSSGLTSPDSSPASEVLGPRHRLPARPKSLDCEALLKNHQDGQQDSWRSTELGPRKSPVNATLWVRPRTNVHCPRLRSARSVSQTFGHQSSRMRSPLGSGTFSPSFPAPVRTTWRC